MKQTKNIMKLSLILISVMILVSSLAIASEFQESHHYTFDNLIAVLGNGTGLGDTIVDDGVDGDDLTITLGSGSVFPFVIGNGFFFDSDVSAQSSLWQTTPYEAVSFTGWIDSRGDNFGIYDMGATNPSGRYVDTFRNSDVEYQYAVLELSCGTFSTKPSTTAQFFHYATILNSTHISFYINNTLFSSTAIGCALNTVPTGVFRYGIALSTLGNFTADDLRMFNYSLSETRLNGIWNNGLGTQDSMDTLFPPPSISTPPIIDLLKPLDNSFFINNNLSVEYTIELDPTANVSSIAYFLNNTLVKNITANQNDTIIVLDGFNSFNVTVQDTNGKQIDIGINKFTVDTINPISDIAVRLPDASILFSDRSIQINADNVNLANHSIYIFDSNDVEQFSQITTNIGSNTNQNNMTIDISVLGVGSFTAVSNQSDILGLSSSDTVSFTIIAPSVPSITCNFGAGQTTCSAVEGDVISSIGATCSFATSTVFTLRNHTNQSGLDTGAGINSSAIVWVFDNINTSLAVGDINVSTSCVNDASSSFNDLIFTVTPLVIPEEESIGAGIIGIATAGASMLVFIIIVLGVIGLTKGRAFGKRGGKK